MKKLLSWLSIPCTALAVLSGSIACVLLVRPFYYVQIGPLGLCAASGLTEGRIRQVYGEIMDYCLGLRPDFSAGGLSFSAERASHFADVRALFLLDLLVLAVSLGLLLVLRVVCRRDGVPRLGGRTGGFWGAVLLLAGTVSVSLLAALDFDRTFTVFHSLFFPGRDNWIFDERTDPVIRLLPQAFFRNCAIAIAALVLLGCVILLVTGRRRNPRPKRLAKSRK